MGWWTFVQGVLTVCPRGRTQAEKEYVLKTILSHLPEVWGSEGPMEVYINEVKGFTSSANHDEFFNHSNLGEGRYGNMFHYQEEYLLTLNAYLRDREFDEAYKDLMKWLHRLSKRVRVEKCLINIHDYEKEKIITNEKDYFSNLYEWDDNWADYLLWEYDKDEEGSTIMSKPKSKRKEWKDIIEKPDDYDYPLAIPVIVEVDEKEVNAMYYTRTKKFISKNIDITEKVKRWKYIK